MDGRDDLLQPLAEIARAIFAAEAASIALLDARAGELVFAAVAGRGAQELVGARFLSKEGIAGRVVETREPLAVDDLGDDPRFARDVATETSYVPDAIMAAPLVDAGRLLGVLSVLDRSAAHRDPEQALELLGLFAAHAAATLGLAERARAAERLLTGGAPDLSAISRLAASLDSLTGERRAAGVRLAESVEVLLR